MIDSKVFIGSFRKHFGDAPVRVFTAPGRINLIGEHTDYNGGFVLPGSIDRCITVVIAPNGTENQVNICATQFDEVVSFQIGGQKPVQSYLWYPFGIVEEMTKRGAKVKGFNMVYGGDVPLGAGMSSSAAVESAIGTALNAVFSLGFSKQELAKIGQMTEHNYVGVRCGIMDQFASIFGEKGKLVRLDCRSLDYKLVSFNPEGIDLVLIDTMVKHELASSEYNVRRAQCEEGVSVIRKYNPSVELLRDVTIDELYAHKDEMDPVVFRRCEFVIGEEGRLMAACDAMEKGDFEEVGRQMYLAHEGLSKGYGVSCDELDFIVDVARSVPGVLGARMMGGGFGGCVIALVKDDSRQEYIDKVKREYKSRFDVDPRVIEVEISDGAREW